MEPLEPPPRSATDYRELVEEFLAVSCIYRLFD